MDSSSSKVTLEWNIFDSNYAVEDKGIYNCGKYGTISHNWWGTNNPNFDEGQIVEWHRITSNDKLSDNEYLQIVLTADSTHMNTYDTCELTFEFVDKNGGHVYYGPQPPTKAVTFESNKKSNFTSKYDHAYSGTTVKYTPFEGDRHIITANFYSASVTESIYV